jgi:hypothetical protein
LGSSLRSLPRSFENIRVTRASSPACDASGSRCTPVDTRVGVRAGRLLGSARAGLERAIDSFVVAVADLAGGAVIATVDTADLELLAAYATLARILRPTISPTISA